MSALTVIEFLEFVFILISTAFVSKKVLDSGEDDAPPPPPPPLPPVSLISSLQNGLDDDDGSGPVVLSQSNDDDELNKNNVELQSLKAQLRRLQASVDMLTHSHSKQM
jgi:hypothetical protein